MLQPVQGSRSHAVGELVHSATVSGMSSAFLLPFLTAPALWVIVALLLPFLIDLDAPVSAVVGRVTGRVFGSAGQKWASARPRGLVCQLSFRGSSTHHGGSGMTRI